MSEHRTVILTNTASGEEVRVTAEVDDLSADELANTPADLIERSTVAQAAERALVKYRRKHPGDYLVTGVERGVAQ